MNTSSIMVGLAFIASIWAGVFLCINNFPTLGGTVCILTFLMEWKSGDEK